VPAQSGRARIGVDETQVDREPLATVGRRQRRQRLCTHYGLLGAQIEEGHARRVFDRERREPSGKTISQMAKIFGRL